MISIIFSYRLVTRILNQLEFRLCQSIWVKLTKLQTVRIMLTVSCQPGPGEVELHEAKTVECYNVRFDSRTSVNLVTGTGNKPKLV